MVSEKSSKRAGDDHRQPQQRCLRTQVDLFTLLIALFTLVIGARWVVQVAYPVYLPAVRRHVEPWRMVLELEAIGGAGASDVWRGPDVLTATVEELQGALSSGEVTSVQLVKEYLVSLQEVRCRISLGRGQDPAAGTGQ